MKILNKIRGPKDIKRLRLPQLEQLCAEIRAFLVKTVSDTGGHLASNLGVVELTVAIHKVFDSPNDKIIWDVGHQCYTHKIITGRLKDFHTLRQEGGVSGFPRASESRHDSFVAGHASTSISAACGLCTANMLAGKNDHVIAVIGDGSFTGGMAYEALNNAGSLENFVVILNHNQMSISKNVGTFARYLASLRSKPVYVKFKSMVDDTMENIPLVGKNLKRAVWNSKSAFKNMVFRSNFFTDLGFAYYGPSDGHSLEELINVLERAKHTKQPVFLHVDTVKGKGYTHAEENPGAFHGVASFDVETGNPDIAEEDSFSSVFGKVLTELATKDRKICAVTAAMKYGTGLQKFAKIHRDRFFDVGIAEPHAVTFSAALAAGGFVPVFAVYSTFLQRSIDQVIHDAAIENRHIVLAVDRAGFVSNDGETHQGIFDVALLSAIPNVTIYSPANYKELERCLVKAIYHTDGIAAVRYPRGNEDSSFPACNKDYSYIYDRPEDAMIDMNTLVITYGRTAINAANAVKYLRDEGLGIGLLKLCKIMPIPENAVRSALKYKNIIFFEEGSQKGGIGEHMLAELMAAGFGGYYKITAVNSGFPPLASAESMLSKYGLDSESMKLTILEILHDEQTS
ncbi:MAG: 1-deoxy-D-xylulose-5-phosphate synthase [Oscillospiraceae bacterium]|nr:1-deoxy-D-xylulose-5-phosphate synthase [Oscillospiraceae bacterium]